MEITQHRLSLLKTVLKRSFNPPITLDNSIENNLQFYIRIGTSTAPADRAGLFVNDVEVLESCMPPWTSVAEGIKIVPVFAGDIGNR